MSLLYLSVYNKTHSHYHTETKYYDREQRYIRELKCICREISKGICITVYMCVYINFQLILTTNICKNP